MSDGKVFFVGVGPGDPELVTRRAERVLREAEIVYHPGRDDQSGYALRIVRQLIAPEAVVRAAAVEFADAADRYQALAGELAALARDGRRVAFITEGDPLVYSTAARLLRALRANWPDTPVEVIPGVTSVTAVACAADEDLAQGSETLVVVPACHHGERLEQLTRGHDRLVLVKVGSAFPQILAWLEQKDLLDRAVYVERAGTEEERIVRDLKTVDPVTISYFSTILVRLRA